MMPDHIACFRGSFPISRNLDWTNTAIWLEREIETYLPTDILSETFKRIVAVAIKSTCTKIVKLQVYQVVYQ